MLSICIPVYNCDVSILTKELHEQGERLSCPFEIILIDDHSTPSYQELNRAIHLKHLKLVWLEENIGRSKIRNLFRQYAQYNYLLFLDCDSSIVSPLFLEIYYNAFRNAEKEVIYGGSLYPYTSCTRNYRLRWSYGLKVESLSLTERERKPYKGFKTNNFIIQKEVFNRIGFDENIKGYGHEDSLFAFRLKEEGIPIFHLENPVLNADNISNREYLKKTEAAVSNLLFVLSLTQFNPEFIQEIRLAEFYLLLKKKHLLGILSPLLKICQPFLLFCLEKGLFSLKMLDLYKLSLFIKHAKAYSF